MRVNMIFRCTIWILAVGSCLVALVQSQDQSGFISIDCGLSDAPGYIDPTTTIRYTSDAEFTTTGTNMDIARVYQDTSLPKQLATVRSFPQGTRNCYTLTPPNGTGTNYLIRASFMYGNYDSISIPPTFDLHIGVDVWDTIKLDNSTQVVVTEMIHTSYSENLDVCLVNTGKGTPFISTLDLRHLNSIIYNRHSGSLVLVNRFYAYNASTEPIRYNDDVYDRIWKAGYLPNGSSITTTSSADIAANDYNLPSAAMRAAIIPEAGSKKLDIFWRTQSSDAHYYVYMHFAELEKLTDNGNETREFNITFNGFPWGSQPLSPSYLSSYTRYSIDPLSGSKLSFTLTSTKKSTLPPIINAIELYKVQELSQPTTNQADVVAMMDVKSTYDVTKNWQGDPCSPRAYSWSGVNCSYDSHTATVISLNLSSSGITGEIAKSISNLTSLQVLDLSNNDLTGGIPDFLADLASLKILYLGGNKFTNTSVPPALTEKSNEGLLDLSLDDTPNQCSGGSCSNKKSTKLIVIIVASISAVAVIAAIVIFTVCLLKRKKNKQIGGVLQGEGEIDQPRHVHITKKGPLSRFSYSDVTEMTKGFSKQIGKGGFGTVYYGSLKDGTEVAAKVLQQSIQGSEQFQTEVQLLMAIRHKNLVALIGYCDEENKLALIYEYMVKGDLQSLIKGSDIVSWKQRLQIAIDSAQGLDYLHNGCRPPIVHRDVKTPNILLDDNMQAKVADFGLSKMFPDEYQSHMTTRVIGSLGYLDPEYHIKEQLNEKSDVYSFGIVLLELITGKAAVFRANLERTNLVHWVSQMINTGDIWNIVDQRLQDAKNPNSVWRVTDVAMACAKPTSNERPTMSQIVTELKECLAMEVEMDSQRNSNISLGPHDSIGVKPVISFTAMGPKPR